MADLEETILKRNVPGRSSKWCDDDSACANDDNDYENNEQQQHHPSSSSIPQSNLDSDMIQEENQERKHRTGVKGVLSDYKESKRIEKIKFENEQLKRKEDFRNATEGTWMKPGETSISIAYTEQQRKLEKQKQEENHVDDDSDDDSSFFDDDENDSSFLDSYRRMRLSEMQQNALPEFGHVQQLHSSIEFSDMIDETDPRVYCIIHLFHDDIGSCRLLNQHLEQLASDSMITYRFFKINALILKQDFDFIGLPCVLIYKAGKEVANLTPITEMLDNKRNGSFTVEEIEFVLRQSCRV